MLEDIKKTNYYSAQEDIDYLLSLIDKYKEESESKFGESIISPLVISLQKENLKYKEEIKDASEVARCQNLELKRHIDELMNDRPFDATYIRQVEYRLEYLHKELKEVLL